MSVTFPFSDLDGLLPREQAVQALDDNGDGEVDVSVWQSVLDTAYGRLTAAAGDETLGDADALWAMKLFCAEILFNRRGFSAERNPFYSQAKAAEARIREISDDAELDDEAAEAGAVTSPLIISGGDQRLI